MRRGLLSGHRDPKADDLRLPYEMPEDWFVRMGVARNWSAQDIADWLGRPETSVRQYIRDDNMGWRYLDDRLKDMNVTMDSDISEVQCRLGSILKRTIEVLTRSENASLSLQRADVG